MAKALLWSLNAHAGQYGGIRVEVDSASGFVGSYLETFKAVGVMTTKTFGDRI